MHGACVQELAHGGVDEGEAGFAVAPGAEVRGIVFPGDVGVFGFEGFVHAGWMNHRGGGYQLVGGFSEDRVGGGKDERLTIRMASGLGRVCKSLARLLLISR